MESIFHVALQKTGHFIPSGICPGHFRALMGISRLFDKDKDDFSVVPLLRTVSTAYCCAPDLAEHIFLARVTASTNDTYSLQWQLLQTKIERSAGVVAQRQLRGSFRNVVSLRPAPLLSDS